MPQKLNISLQREFIGLYRCFDEVNALTLASSLGIGPVDPIQCDLEQFLTFCLKNHVDLHYIIELPQWSEYVDLMLDNEGKSILATLAPWRTIYLELLIMRVYYKYGRPIISDANYDALLTLYGYIDMPCKALALQSYEDDVLPDIVLNVLRKRDIFKQKAKQGNSKFVEIVRQHKTPSIRPVESYREAFDFIHSSSSDLLFSAKIDGQQVRVLYCNGELRAATSKARASDGFDYTEAISRRLPSNINTNISQFIVEAEAFVYPNSLPILRTTRPDKEWKTPKSSTVSIIRKHEEYTDEEINTHLALIAHGGDNIGSNILDKYNALEQLHFAVPPHFTVKYEEIPKEFDEFCAWLKINVFDKMEKLSIELPTDGVVCEKITPPATNDRPDHYTDNNIALKFEQWQASVYTSKVKAILIEQQRVKASVRLEIEPVITKDFNEARFVNAGSLNILVKNNISVGSLIKFKRKSEAINTLEV